MPSRRNLLRVETLLHRKISKIQKDRDGYVVSESNKKGKMWVASHYETSPSGVDLLCVGQIKDAPQPHCQEVL
jgi:hypothetical protein